MVAHTEIPRLVETLRGIKQPPCDAAADEIERLQNFAKSFGLCTCVEGMCDPIHDFQCRAREALTGVSNVKRVSQE